ncbi:MAG: restriction endonuclease [Candidatus Pacearchaeota archaeon]
MSEQIYVKKLNGEKERYKKEKLVSSLEKAGASKKAIDKVMKKVPPIIHDGIKTAKLYDFVHEELKKIEEDSCCRYNLKRSMMDLRIHGGFVFEDFMARILQKKGYKTNVGDKYYGKKITHEIDIDAKKDKKRIMVEAKHHSKKGLKTDVQTSLYVYARFLDIKESFDFPMIATNTKFSDQAKKYSKGVGMKMMGWKHPKEDSLEKNIEKYKLYPITILPLSRKQLVKYFKKDILTVDELKERGDLSEDFRKKISKIMKES